MLLRHGAPCGPGAIPLPFVFSLPHILLYLLLVYFTFPFFPSLTRFIYFLAFPSLLILPQ